MIPGAAEVVVPILLLLACGAEVEPDPATTPPALDVEALGQRGPFGAGTRTIEITGSTGTPLTLQLWYPTDAADADILYDGLLPGRAALNAAPACEAVAGLVAFSHGFGGTRAQSPFLTEHLASHGSVVVSPDHAGNTLLDQTAPFDEILTRRPLDVSDAVDAALDDADLGPCLDEADGFVVIGHSFGGYTALAVGGATVNEVGGGPVDLSDPRATGVVGLAPWDAAGGITDGTSEIAIPTLILTGELDVTTPLAQVRRLYDPLAVEPRWLGVFPAGGHYTFSPVACILFSGDGCGEAFVPAEVADPLINAGVTAFVEGVRGTAGAFDAVAVPSAELEWESAP